MKKLNEHDYETINRINETISALRTIAGMSVVTLATEAEISENTVKSLFRNESYPTLPTLIRICNVFDLSLWEFFLMVDGKNRYGQQKYRELLDSYDRLELKHKELILFIAKELTK